MAMRSTRSTRQAPVQQPEPQSRAKWTAATTKILVDLMVDQVHQGNRQNNSFSKSAWKVISDDFCEKTGFKWDREQLKNRYAVLRKQYAAVKALLDLNDFKWDELTGAIIGEAGAWERYIKEHPDAESVRSCGCSLYKQLCIIFSEPGSNGVHDGFTDQKGRICPIYCPEPLSTLKESSSSESEEEADAAEKIQPATPVNGGRKRGRKGIDDFIANGILEMAAASRLRTAAIKKLNEKFSITDCVKALDGIEDVDEQIYLAALDLFDNRVAREIFLSLKVEKRLPWLHCKCSAHSS